jgi:hypothetical protein
VLSRLLAESNVFNAFLPSRVRFSLRDSNVYFLALDVAPVTARKPPIFALANVIQSLAQMPHDMELVEQNRGLRRMTAVASRNGFHMSITG